LRNGTPGPEGLTELVTRYRENTTASLLKLERALTGFDEAPIFTIHGFCQRTLKDRAFESGSLFTMDLLTDESELWQEVADDYWRSRFYEAEAVLVALALKAGLQPRAFVPWLRRAKQHPWLRVLSRVEGRSRLELEKAVGEAFERAGQLWRTQEQQIRALLDSAKKWAKGDYAKAALLERMLEGAMLSFSKEGLTRDSFRQLSSLAQTRIAENTRVRAVPPRHEFFRACEDLDRSEDDLLVGWRIDFVQYAQAELAKRKERRKVQSYDDLLLRLHAALAGPTGSELVREVRRRFRAALIDEFQDTDPVQCDIFRRLFAAPRSGPPDLELGEPALFLIGDPKQAIYGFRGADIFTYLDVAEQVAHGYTLDQNWRSETPLVHAVNRVFAGTEPFVLESIHFPPAVAAGKTDKTPLREGGERHPPLEIWFMRRGENAKEISKNQAEETLPAVVASEIVRLLNGPTTLGERRLTPRDIAVLVVENRQARLMQQALRAVNVPSVLHTEESVFASPEARALALVLASVAHPGQERALRAALVTDFLGLSAPQLEALAADASGWQKRIERAYQARERWLRDGFAAMFRTWLQLEGVRPRLLGLPDGERRLTNLLHLSEVLHQAAHSRQLGPAGLVRWLNEQIAASGQSEEEHQVRLERDDEAVRLVTIHKSKGLEYPVVFCPFSWRGAESKRGQPDVLFHRRTPVASGPGQRSELFLDLGSAQEPEHRALAFREKLAESLRLLYVALTRARNRCCFVWGAFYNAGLSAPAWLFHRPPALTSDLRACLSARFETLSDETLWGDLQRMVDPSATDADGVAGGEGGAAPADTCLRELPEASSAGYQPDTSAPAPLAPRRFTRAIRRDWRISSFSSLIRHFADDERPDYDRDEAAGATATAADPMPDEEAAPAGIFAFPRGTGPGSCLHKIFERLDFTATAPAHIGEVVQRELEHHGLAVAPWKDEVAAMVRRALTVALQPGQPGFTLSRIPRASRVNEMEFQFPTRNLTPTVLRQAMGTVESVPDFSGRLERLGFQAAQGFIKGYIDLVLEYEGRFHIIDWKSNWLGARVEDYAPATMHREMADKYYVLQYHLYVVALHQYLQRRIPDYDYERHMGSVLYLFLRGLDPARPELGVFRDRPPRARIDALARALVHARPNDAHEPGEPAEPTLSEVTP